MSVYEADLLTVILSSVAGAVFGSIYLFSVLPSNIRTLQEGRLHLTSLQWIPLLTATVTTLVGLVTALYCARLFDATLGRGFRVLLFPTVVAFMVLAVLGFRILDLVDE